MSTHTAAITGFGSPTRDIFTYDHAPGMGGLKIPVDERMFDRMLEDVATRGVERDKGPGGGVSNELQLLRKLGHTANEVAVFGEDPVSTEVRDRLEQAGVGTDRSVAVPDHQITQSIISNLPDRIIHILRGHLPQDNLRRADINVGDYVDSGLEGAEAVVVSSVGHTSLAEIIIRETSPDVLLSYTPSSSELKEQDGPAQIIGLLTAAIKQRKQKSENILLAINDAEARKIFDFGADTNEERMAREITDHFPVTLSLTAGDSGLIVAQKGSLVFQRADTVQRFSDSTGAGDATAAGVLHGTLQGWKHGEIAEFGAFVGARAVEYVGATTYLGHIGLNGATN